MVKTRKQYKFLAILLAAIILSTSIPLTIMGFNEKNRIALDNASKEDKRIASEISNETGVSIEEIFELKSYGRSWNEVLSLLKNRSNFGEKSDKEDRDNLLLNTGLDEEFIAKLKSEGFSEQDITEVKLLFERVAFQLQEITADSHTNQVKVEAPKVDFSSGITDEDISAYEELAKKIDIKNAVYFMLKLKTDFGSYEKVFDEYIYSLQADIDLNDYIKDKKAYLESKDEKELLLDRQKIITLEKIEEKSIEKALEQNKDSNGEAEEQKNDNTANKAASDITKPDINSLPDVPKPNMEEVKPKNPTDEIMNEIKAINPLEK